MMLAHHGALDKLKLFHLEDGGFNHQRDYKIDPLLLIEQSELPLESEKIIDDFAKKLRSLYFKNIKKLEKK